jgi:hypothetical protein
VLQVVPFPLLRWEKGKVSQLFGAKCPNWCKVSQLFGTQKLGHFAWFNFHKYEKIVSIFEADFAFLYSYPFDDPCSHEYRLTSKSDAPWKGREVHEKMIFYNVVMPYKANLDTPFF